MASLMPTTTEYSVTPLAPFDDNMETASDAGLAHAYQDELIDVDLDDVIAGDDEGDQNMMDENAEHDDDEMNDDHGNSTSFNEHDEELRDASERGDADLDLIVENEHSVDEDVDLGDGDQLGDEHVDSTGGQYNFEEDVHDAPSALGDVHEHAESARADVVADDSYPQGDNGEVQALAAIVEPGDEEHRVSGHDDFEHGPSKSGGEHNEPSTDRGPPAEATEAAPVPDAAGSPGALTHPCSIIIYTDEAHFDYREQYLFPNDAEEKPFLDDITLFNQPLAQLIQRCHQVLLGDEDMTRQLVLRFDRLGLRITQDMKAASDCCIENVADVYTKLFLNQGHYPPAPMFIQISVEQPFSERFKQLHKDSQDGVSFEDVALPDPYIAPNFDEAEDDASEEDSRQPKKASAVDHDDESEEDLGELFDLDFDWGNSDYADRVPASELNPDDGHSFPQEEVKAIHEGVDPPVDALPLTGSDGTAVNEASETTAEAEAEADPDQPANTSRTPKPNEAVEEEGHADPLDLGEDHDSSYGAERTAHARDDKGEDETLQPAKQAIAEPDEDGKVAEATESMVQSATLDHADPTQAAATTTTIDATESIDAAPNEADELDLGPEEGSERESVGEQELLLDDDPDGVEEQHVASEDRSSLQSQDKQAEPTAAVPKDHEHEATPNTKHDDDLDSLLSFGDDEADDDDAATAEAVDTGDSVKDFVTTTEDASTQNTGRKRQRNDAEDDGAPALNEAKKARAE